MANIPNDIPTGSSIAISDAGWDEMTALKEVADKLGLDWNKYTKQVGDHRSFDSKEDQAKFLTENPEALKAFNDWMLRRAKTFNQPMGLYDNSGNISNKLYSPTEFTDKVIQKEINSVSQGGLYADTQVISESGFTPDYSNAQTEGETKGFQEPKSGITYKRESTPMEAYEYDKGATSQSGYAVTQKMSSVADKQYQDALDRLKTNPNSFTAERDKNLVANYELQHGQTGTETTAETPTGTTTTGTTDTTTSTQTALEQLENDPSFQTLPEDLKSLYRQVVSEWDVGTEINMEGVLSKFKEIQDTTIDPYFSEQVIKPFVADVTAQYQSLQQQREQELEAERATAGENIRQAKEGLEAAGRTFTGKSIEDLGKESAYAQDGTAIPGQTPFATEDGSKYFYEGTVNQANRLMSTGTAERYQKNLQELGRQAESALGSTQAGALGIPYNPVGGITGSIEEQRQEKLSEALTAEGEKARMNLAQDQPLQYNF